MARFLKENDYRGPDGHDQLQLRAGSRLPARGNRFRQSPNYDYSKSIPATLPAVLNQLHGLYDKPVLQSEIGINWQNDYSAAQVDPAGITLVRRPGPG